jgi:hypothetical protein
MLKEFLEILISVTSADSPNPALSGNLSSVAIPEDDESLSANQL